MALPTGRYKVLLLWAKRVNANSKHWQLEFVISDTGERGSAFVFDGDIGRLVGAAAFGLINGVWEPRDVAAPRHVVMLDLVFNKKFGNTRASEAHGTGLKMDCDIRRNTMHFEPEEF